MFDYCPPLLLLGRHDTRNHNNIDNNIDKHINNHSVTTTNNNGWRCAFVGSYEEDPNALKKPGERNPQTLRLNPRLPQQSLSGGLADIGV